MNIMINDIETLGLVSVTINKTEDGFVKNGALKTHIYVEDIETIQCDKFNLYGVDVYSESFGSNDPCIIYSFTFEDFECNYDNDMSIDDLLELYKVK